jgi:hypothetical protein
MDRCWDLDFGDKFVEGFTRYGMRFQPPTPPTLSLEGDSSYSKAKLPHVRSVPLVWDMEDMYGASKGPHQVFEAIDTIELDDFIWEFDIWCDMQQLQNLQ